jgi:periplasmic divalent cation tolerance protein
LEDNERMTDFYLLITTVESAEDAHHMAQLAVEKRLAGCVQVQSSCQSFYRWRDALEVSTEYPVHFKTNTSCLDSLIELIKTNHPYEVPEIITVRLDSVDADYANWLSSSLGKES